MASDTAVIIPFYQEQPGILRRAVLSALGQRDVPMPLVVVIDDGSPISAQSELADLLTAYPDNLLVIRQPNGGPAAARNTALRQVAGKTEFIAFLDSDDVWKATHLSIACRSLRLGYDFYFCDVVNRQGDRRLFETKSFPDSDCHILIKELGVHEYRGDLFGLILDRCPIVTPAVVYRASAVPFWFQEELKSAGEDYSFWLEVAYSQKRTVFSTAAGVQTGHGVNIYAGVEWGTKERIKQIYFDQLYVSRLPRRFELTPAHRTSYLRLSCERRQAFVENLCGAFAQGKTVEVWIVLRYAAMDPKVILSLPLYVAGRLLARLKQLIAARRVSRERRGQKF
jgi:succinoglycan biosynthesis protein ExoW